MARKVITEHDDDSHPEKEWEKFDEVLVIIRKGADVGPGDLAKVHKHLKHHPGIVKFADKKGQNLLHSAIKKDSPAELVRMLLDGEGKQSAKQAPSTAAKVKYGDQLPLHLVLETEAPNLDILNRLLDAYPEAVSERDEDDCMLLHIALSKKPLRDSINTFAQRVVALFPQACKVKSHGQYPLLHCIENGHPEKLTNEVCKAWRAAAAVPSKAGKLPLHIAVEKNLDTSIIQTLIEAYPAALLTKMPIAGGGALLPLEFSLRKKQEAGPARHAMAGTQASKDLLTCLMTGGEHPSGSVITSTARATVYARAAAMGRVTLDPWDPIKEREENDKRERKDHRHPAPDDGFMSKADTMDKSFSVATSAALGAGGRGSSFKKSRVEKVKVEPPVQWHLPVPFDVQHDWKVFDLKKAIQDCADLGKPAVTTQRLKMNGKLLRDDLDMMQVIGTSFAEEQDEAHVVLELRFDILSSAIKNNAEKELILQLLSLRPEAAKEEDNDFAIPLHTALKQRIDPHGPRTVGKDGKVIEDPKSHGDMWRSQNVILKLIEVYPEAVRKPLSKSEGKFPIHVALENQYPCEIIEAILDRCQEDDWTDEGHFLPEGAGDDEIWGDVPAQRLGERSDRLRSNRGGRRRVSVQVPLPLHIAIEFADSQKTVRLMMDRMEAQEPSNGQVHYMEDSDRPRRCPVLARCHKTGLTALEKVLETRREEFFQVVLARTLQKDEHALKSKGRNDQGVLHVAVLNNASNRVIKKLCAEYPAATRERDVRGSLPIHLAAERQAGFASIRELLAANRETVNILDGRGRTPLQIAVTNQATSGVVFEFARVDEAALRVKDRHGRNLLELAAAADAPASVMHELMEYMPQDLYRGFNALASKPETHAAGEALQLSTQPADVQVGEKGALKYSVRMPKQRMRLEENDKVNDVLNAFSDIRPDEDEDTSRSTSQGSAGPSQTFLSSFMGSTFSDAGKTAQNQARRQTQENNTFASTVSSWFSW
mmetsp:Transcript_10766/g.24582  ORF Transcript_10766/g.24582 Transcript_10766/m.24582 type:complete len:993 (-) Transcript_10766:351-3329(-)|eukprot:CAMPEP_0178372938 /NCGR_PEP_ID=MMETSP0689_2-20121128/1610_1 /TAXON_ID=160604 /ORGANISM="Amphidinium massartii, Strain CS-259" /LENGTH=992 /DNA_ID=CAMNT_0019992875 /DNA_START=27 /DNA_END=3005 /DNA_ORIENTATION=-